MPSIPQKNTKTGQLNIAISKKIVIIEYERNREYQHMATNSFLTDLPKYIDYRVHKTSITVLLAAAVCLALSFILPESYGLKNAPPEFAQLGLLILCAIYAFTANNTRRLFIFAGFVIIFLSLREINYGRTLWFFADENDPTKFPKWKDIPYGWLAHVLVGVYLAILAAVFIWKKLWRDIRDILLSSRLPVWELCLAIVMAAAAHTVEEVTHNSLLEECLELGFYICLTTLFWRYTRSKCQPVE